MLRRALLAAVVLIAAWLVACLVLFVWPPAETGAPAHADAVVVLSGEQNRLPPALALLRRGLAPVLAISSIGHTPYWLSARRLCAAKRYRSATVVCFEASPYSTQGEAEAVARLARARGWHRIVLVSNTYHLTRARMLFDRCYRGRLWLVGVGSAWWKLPLNWLDETTKLVYQLTVQRGC